MAFQVFFIYMPTYIMAEEYTLSLGDLYVAKIFSLAQI